MEKSRAIELLKLAIPIKALTQQEYSDFVEAVNMGMDALEQPTSPDTIDRQAAINALQKCRKHCIDPFDSYHIDIQDAENQLWKVPTIQPEKAQLSQEGTTSDLISRMETVEHLRRVLDATVPITDYDEGYVDGVEFGISTVSTMPTIQSQSTTGQLNDGVRSTARSTDLIDRQAALDIFDDYNVSVENGELEAYSRDRKRLCELSTVQPEPTRIITETRAIPSDDDRVSLSEKVTATYYDEEYEEWSQKTVTVRDVLDSVCDEYTVLPTIQPERKKGEWIEISSMNHTYKCSECGRLLVNVADGRNNVSKHYPYCHCGADMRGERQK